MNLDKLKPYYKSNTKWEINYFYISDNTSYSGNKQIMIRYVKNYFDRNLMKNNVALPNIIISLLFSGDIIKIQLALNLIE